MDGLFVHGVIEVISTMDTTAHGLGYRLYVVREGAVPLAGNIMTGSFFPLTVAVMALLFLGMAAGLYVFACMQYRRRIVELTGQPPKLPAGFRLKRLKETAREIEYELTGENI